MARSRGALLAAVILLPALAACLAPSESAPPTETAAASAAIGAVHDLAKAVVTLGYLEAEDGVLLAYHSIVPGEPGQYPALLTYHGYAAGHFNGIGPEARRALEGGYAYVAVSVRGTGCSGGEFDFLDPQHGRDGARAVEWIANASWSNGKVGMVGKSFAGIMQLLVAIEQPPHLVAIAPGHYLGDLYRDVGYPGGMFNYAFATSWGLFGQPTPGLLAVADDARDDPTCVANQQGHATNARKNVVVQAQEHPFDDALFEERSPIYRASKITVPLFTTVAWQDEQLPPRGLRLLAELTSPWWAIASNGDHETYEDPVAVERRGAFFDRFVKGIDNGFEATPRLTIGWEVTNGPLGERRPAWTTAHDAWPPTAVSPMRLNLTSGASLVPGVGEGTTTWLYPGLGPTNTPFSTKAIPLYALGEAANRAPLLPTRVVFRTAPLAEDLVLAGTANVTLWIETSAPDVDLQVTFREVREDGTAVHIQRGWLRASHFALDAERSTAFSPYHPHEREDPLPAGPFPVAIEVFPFAHVLRAGTSLEIGIDAPQVIPELWGFAIRPTPASVSILHDAEHPSAIVLPALPGIEAPKHRPACGSLLRQACGPG